MRNLYQQDPILERCNNITQILSIKDVINYTSLSRSTIYEMINEESERYDPTFPKMSYAEESVEINLVN